MIETNRPPKFVLPGRWGRINLESEASIHRSIRQIADEATRRRDDLATTRAELRARFERAATAAKEGGATDFYLAFNLTPAIPLPAWISVFTPRIDSTDFDSLGLGELRSFLEAGTKNWGPDEAQVESFDREAEQPLQVVRHSWRRTREISEGEAQGEVEFLEADYWIAATDPNRIALLTFSTAYAQLEDEMLGLFDAIVRTIRWPAPERQSESSDA